MADLLMPKLGGDTLFADMEAAYDGLSSTFKKMIDGLTAVHDFQNFRVLFTKSEEDQAKLRKIHRWIGNHLKNPTRIKLRNRRENDLAKIERDYVNAIEAAIREMNAEQTT